MQITVLFITYGEAVSTIIALLLSFSTTIMTGLLALIIWSHWMVVSHNMLHLSSSSTPSGWCSHHFSLLFNPFLQQSFQWTSLAIMSSLVLFLRQTVILANYMIYCFTLLATQPTKRGVHGLVYVNDI